MPNGRPLQQDNYPAEYHDARLKFSPDFLLFFDNLLAQHPEKSYTPSNTLGGMIYAYSSILLMGLPVAAIALSNLNASHQRQELYQQLIQIANEPARLATTYHPAILKALRTEFLTLTDLTLCPTETLYFLTTPHIQHYLKIDDQKISQARQNFNAQIHRLRHRLSQEEMLSETKRLSLHVQIDELTRERDLLKSKMEQLRDANYASRTLFHLIPELPAWYITIERDLAEQLKHVARRVEFLRFNANASEHHQQLLTTATLLHETLTNARRELLATLTQPNNQARFEEARRRFIDISQRAIQQAKPILTQDHQYDWSDLLADIGNLLVLVGTCGLSYAVTGEFRLFKPRYPVEEQARQFGLETEHLVRDYTEKLSGPMFG
jgi:hypothetical protein